jgi:uncharacterized repeat protein (TIGR03803 family)
MSLEALEERRLLSTLTALGSFDGTNGTDPESAGVVFDANGDLFGTTYSGGAHGVGTVWELAKGSGAITALASFDLINGGGPLGGVALDSDGNIYGAAVGSGTNDNGMVWELAKRSSTVTDLATFDRTDGDGPTGGVTLDANGNLFGTAQGGGTRGTGTVWELAKGSGTIMALASFNLSAQSVYGGVTLDANGNLFGTTGLGGANNMGTVWKLVPGSGTIRTLASFDGTNGESPFAGVTLDANGDLFGTASGGGANNMGTVWELAKGSSTITALASFNGSNGHQPLGGVTFDANGNLYGTTAFGGASSDNGVVWELANGSGSITALASFDHTTGTDPKAPVTIDANGNLFGTASVSGANAQGTVWELITDGDVSVAVASSAPDSRYGQAVTFTATVTLVTPGLPAPSGNVQFQVDGANVGGHVNLVGGRAVSPAIATLSAGRHTITALYANDPNYHDSSGSTSQTVDQAHLTVTADDKAMTYGGAVPALTYTITGFVDGDTAAVVSGAPGLTTTATSASGVGNYAVTVAPGTLAAANYDFPTLVAGTLSVTPAPLTIRADDLTRGVGQPDPPLTASYLGFVNGDGPSSLASSVVLSTTATAGSLPGVYPITVGGAASPNYAIKFVAGTLTVVASTPVTVTDVQLAFNRRHQVTQLIVDFSGPVGALAGSLTYRLTVNGKHARTIALESPKYSPSTDSVTLVPQRPFGLNRQVELRVHGLPGGDAVAILSRQGVYIEARRQPANLPRLSVAAVDHLKSAGSREGTLHRPVTPALGRMGIGLGNGMHPIRTIGLDISE